MSLINRQNNAGFIIIDNINNTQCWSPLFNSTLGYEHNEIQPSFENLENLMHPSDFEIIKEILKTNNDVNNKDLRIKLRFKTKSGTYIIFNTSIRSIIDREMEHYYS
ncbi:MAG: PAS domain-containing protein [Tenuifilaceae bacterium]